MGFGFSNKIISANIKLDSKLAKYLTFGNPSANGVIGLNSVVFPQSTENCSNNKFDNGYNINDIENIFQGTERDSAKKILSLSNLNKDNDDTINKEELSEMIKSIDTDADGKISKEESSQFRYSNNLQSSLSEKDVFNYLKRVNGQQNKTVNPYKSNNIEMSKNNTGNAPEIVEKFQNKIDNEWTQKFPNLADNIKEIKKIYLTYGAEMAKDIGMTDEPREALAKDTCGGAYDYWEHEIGVKLDGSINDQEYVELAHELTHAIDYVDTDMQSGINYTGGDMKRGQWGSYSTSEEYKSALYSDLNNIKNLDGNDKDYQLLASDINYIEPNLANYSSENKNEMCRRTSTESFAVIGSYILNDSNGKQAAMKKLFPSTYQLVLKHIQEA
ncbi:MAG: hypothetical protein PHV37_02905 [Candidatus Gastranaerophilales bacterium]|nr:hypothetical protein [Candidatus Gastranaerophilales bacterium]